MISERLAKKFFGDAWHEAVGQTLKIDERPEFKVTGIFENPPAISSLNFDFILPAKEFIQRNDWVESWFNGRVCKSREDAERGVMVIL